MPTSSKSARAGRPRRVPLPGCARQYFGHGGSGAARREREALKQAGGGVRQAEDREFLILVDLLAEATGVGARKHTRVCEGDERDADGRGHEAGEVIQARRTARRMPGDPAGTVPTTGTSLASPSVLTTRVAPTTAARMAGKRGATRRKTMISASEPAPIANAVALASLRLCTRSRRAGMSFSAGVENPRSLGIWTTITVTAMPMR